jgi:hypothetical protein
LNRAKGYFISLFGKAQTNGERYTDRKMCASFFSITFNRRTFVHDKYVTTRALDMRRNICISIPFKIKLEYVETILLKVPGTKFHENTFSDS